MNKTHLEDILNALNVLALERSSEGGFTPIGTPPAWLDQFTSVLDGARDSGMESGFRFLDNFLIEASEFWNKKKTGCAHSGIWIEGDASGKKYMFEAMALTSLNKQILIIARDQKFNLDKQSLIQKGRELALNYQMLERLEQDLRQTRAELEMRVKERTEDLELSNRRLAEELKAKKRIEEERTRMEHQLLYAQKMEAIGTLSSGIAHDFNNILSAIVGYTELSLALAASNETLKGNLEKILAASFRARDLVRQVLTFSCEAKQDPKPIQIKPVVTEVLDLIRASFPSTIEIKRELHSDGTVFADPSQIHQVVMNLCTNARHAMEENGGILTVDLEDIRIISNDETKLSVLPKGDYIKLSIQDTGCGMTAETVSRIFDPFFTTKKEGKGTGLGLSVVHGIIKSSGGAVTVDTALGKGSIFHVVLPNYKVVSVQKTMDESALPKGGERILVVDDDPFQTEIAMRQLEALGYSVITFTDSTQALFHFTKQPQSVDVVITDMVMPKLSGTVLAEEMLRIRPDLPIILCSGFSDSLTEERSKDMGIRAYLMKPISIRDLATSIRNCLREKPVPEVTA